MSKKIGVISNYDIQNYGNRLQNYAVCKVLEKAGLEPYTLVKADIQYKPHDLMGKRTFIRYIFYSLFSPSKAEEMRKQVGYPNRMNHFYAFEKQFVHLDIRQADMNWRKMDFYALGSDQVLHPFYIERMEELSIKNLSEEQLRRSIMVSPSFGVSEIREELYPVYKSFLNKVYKLSCREKEGAELIHKISGRHAQVVIDPTMLLTVDDWRKVSKPIPVKKPYILKFFLEKEEPKTTNAIEKYAKTHGLEIRKLLDENDVDTYYAGPSEFLWLIDHAQFVCTDSFHGSVFSILFHKKFFVFPRSGKGKTMGSRITTLLNTYGISERMIEDIIPWDTGIDYKNIETILTKKRSEYNEYILNSLKGDNENVSC